MARLFNKGKRTITYFTDKVKTAAHTDELGKQIADVYEEGTIGPEQIKTIHKAEADKLKRLFGHELVDLDNKDDLENHVTAKSAPAEAPAGNISLADAEAQKQEAIKAAVAEALLVERARTGKELHPEEETLEASEVAAGTETAKNIDLIKKIDGMDRATLLKFIADEKLNIAVDGKNIPTLKKLVLTELEAKAAAE